MTCEINIYSYNNDKNSTNKPFLIEEMINKEKERINEMNKFLDYAHRSNQDSFIKENTIYFFGKEKNNIYDVLNQNKLI